MLRKALYFPLILISSVFLDAVAGPFLAGPWVGFHFSAAAVALIGLKRGKWTGLFAGWFCGALLGSFSSAPLGLYLLSLGGVGFVAGCFAGLGLLRLPAAEAALLLALLFFEDALSGALARAALGAPWRPAFFGIFLTALLTLFFLRRRADNLIA